MTENQTAEARAGQPVGQALGGALGQAQSVLTGLLGQKAAQAGTERESYLALLRLGALGDTAGRDQYAGDLVDSLDLDPLAAAELADRLAAAGLVTADGQTVSVGAEGARLRAEVAGSIAAITGPIYESLSPADIETTIRTLQYLTARVRAAGTGS